MAMRFALCLAVVAVALSSVDALTKDEMSAIQGSILKFVSECSEEYGVTEEQIKEAKEKKNFDGIDNCAIGCVFKKAKLITDKGLFDPEHAKEIAPKILSAEEDQKKFFEIAEDCTSVNSEKVSDGEKGCERAKLLFACLAKHKEALQI